MVISKWRTYTNDSTSTSTGRGRDRGRGRGRGRGRDRDRQTDRQRQTETETETRERWGGAFHWSLVTLHRNTSKWICECKLAFSDCLFIYLFSGTLESAFLPWWPVLAPLLLRTSFCWYGFNCCYGCNWVVRLWTDSSSSRGNRLFPVSMHFLSCDFLRMLVLFISSSFYRVFFYHFPLCSFSLFFSSFASSAPFYFSLSHWATKFFFSSLHIIDLSPHSTGWPAWLKQDSTAGHFWCAGDNGGSDGALATRDTLQPHAPDRGASGGLERGLWIFLLQAAAACPKLRNIWEHRFD